MEQWRKDARHEPIILRGILCADTRGAVARFWRVEILVSGFGV